MNVHCTDQPFVIGLDLGQQNDYTAVALLERTDQHLGRSPYDYSYRVRSVLAVALACWQAQRTWPHLLVPGDHAFLV